MDIARYSELEASWPRSGRHILARYDATSVVVYQAYRPAIGHFAVERGFFGGAFSLSRMSWLKPNFLWMMYRSGWGRKEGQEVVLAVTIRRDAFDAILAAAVPSSHDPSNFETREAWQAAVASSDVRLQWDPDHDPTGAPVERRAIQLGLRGPTLARYAKEWLVRVEDVSAFVREQEGRPLHELRVPAERVYPVTDEATRRRLRLDG